MYSIFRNAGRSMAVGFAIAGLLSLAGPKAQAQTEAEAAAASQRKLTEAEWSRLEKDCPLPAGREMLSGFPAGITATRVSLPEQNFLGLIIFGLTGDSAGNSRVDVFPALPRGGIGKRDYCDTIVYGEIAATPHSAVVGLRLRPGLDLRKDYPTSLPQIEQFGQWAAISAMGFARIEIADAKEAPWVVAKIADLQMIASDRLYFVVDQNLYVPLRE